MKILIATGLYPPDIGGPATYTKFLERHLSGYGIEYTVVAFTHVRKYPKIIRHVLYLKELLKVGKTVDIIYALDTISVGIPALIASRILRKKLFLRVPGDYAWEQGQQRFGITDTLDDYLKKKEKPFAVRVLAWAQSRVARSATRVVVPSEYMKTVVSAWGVRAENVVRIYSALNPILVALSKEELREKYKYNGFVCITAARLAPWKGIEALIDVTTTLRAQGVDIMLEILGDGDLREHLAQYIEKKDAMYYVHLRGQVNKSELAERIKGADAFVLNTSYEGLSHQLLEVMEIGVPIVTTPVGGNVELITHEVEGLVVPWNNRKDMSDALMRIRDKDPILPLVLERAHAKVLLFREEVIIPKIIQLFT